MPRLEEIEQFKAELNSLGHEPSILAERGEQLEDVAMPDSGLDEDLDALLNEPEEETGIPLDSIEDLAGDEEGDDQSEAAADDEEFFAPDTGDDLQPSTSAESDDDFSIPDDLLSGFSLDDETEEPGSEPEAGTDEDDEFSLPEGLFEPAGESDETEEPDDEFALPDDAEEDEFSLPDEAFNLPDEDDNEFALPEEPEEADTDTDAGGEEDQPFEIPEEFAAAADILSLDEEDTETPDTEDLEFEESLSGAEEEPEFSGDDFSLPDEFSMDQLEDDFDSAPSEDSGEALPEAEAPLEDDFSIPDEESSQEPEGLEFEPENEELSFSDEDAGVADFSMPDGFPFEESDAGAEEDFSIPEEASGGDEETGFGDEFEIPTAGDIEDIDEANFEVDEFSLGDLGEQFGEIEEGPASVSEEALNPAVAVSEEIPSGEDELELGEEQFARLQQTLNMQPLNLRIVIEELIGEKDLAGAHLQKMVQALVRGASAKELAALVGNITGKKIKIPTRYEKSTGADFEAEKGTFAYAFKHSILPVLRLMAVGAVLLGILTFLTLTFVYRPIHALILYNSGYEQLEQDSYREANLFFDNAIDEWRFENQYFRFAEGFQQKRQFGLAAEKYEQLLRPVLTSIDGELVKNPEIKRIRGKYRQGILDYAGMETAWTENFEHAEDLLDILLGQDKHDYDALLAAGDNYLAWGEYEYGRYDDARRSYATLIQYYGGKYELLFRMLRYFIRVDNYTEVVRLKEQFENDPGIKVEPDAYAELGGYLIDRNDLDDVRKVLSRAMEVDQSVPEIHYHLARYLRRIEDEEEERKALDFAEYYLEASRPLGRQRLKLLIDTYDRQGEVDYEDGEYLTAEEYLLEARESYEEALERGILEPEAMFGRIYRNLGNLYYYIAAEFDAALEMFESAEKNGYSSSGVSYRKGYIHYNNERYSDALAEFYLAAGDYSTNENLLFATGNTLFQRSDYFAAQGYYTHLLDELEQRRRNISVLLPRERDEDYSLIDRMIRVNNNLGVTLQRLSLASGDRQKFSRALVHFTDSTEYFDLLSRDPESMERGSAVNLGYLNQRAMLYPVENYELQIYTGLPLDQETLWME